MTGEPTASAGSGSTFEIETVVDGAAVGRRSIREPNGLPLIVIVLIETTEPSTGA